MLTTLLYNEYKKKQFYCDMRIAWVYMDNKELNYNTGPEIYMSLMKNNFEIVMKNYDLKEIIICIYGHQRLPGWFWL